MLFTLTLGAAVCARAFPPQGISPDVMTQFKAPQWIQPRAETGEFVASAISTWGSKINMIVTSIAMGFTTSLVPTIVTSFHKNNLTDVNKK